MYRKLTKHALVFGLFLSSYILNAQSPGGIGRQSLWLRGNFLPDKAQTRILNFHPATSMDNSSAQIQMPRNIKDLKRATIFTVFQQSELDQDRSVWQMTGDFGDLLLSTRQLSSKSGKMNMVFEKTMAAPATPKKPVAVISTYLRRQGSKSVSENEEGKEIAIHFGDPGSTRQAEPASGLIAEFIVYETILKEEQIARIESYLALKYGITLEKNYVNSIGEIIWNRKKEPLYSNNIAGIGRDDRSALYQKQGTSSSTSDQLIIGIDKIFHSNAQNPGEVNDRDYLIWGDNGQAFSLNRSPDPAVGDILLSEKKWLMKSSGRTANKISTTLEIDTKTILPPQFPKEYFCLAIDRSGSGDFVPGHCTYIIPDSISPEGIASFSRVVWDTDGSGRDVFNFGLKSRVSADVMDKGAAKLLSFSVYPNPISDGHYNIAATLNKPTDLYIQLYDHNLRLLESRKLTGQTDLLLSGYINGAAGVYIVKLLTPDKEFSKIIIRQ